MVTHAARSLRLVVDNSFAASSIPCSAVQSKRAKCHFPGMTPRRSHIETAFSVNPGKVPASAERPPSLLTIEATSTMVGQIATGSPGNQELFVPILGNFEISGVDTYITGRENRFMNDQIIKKRAWKTASTQRMLELIADMGMDADQFAAAFHELIGCTGKKAALQALNRESLESYYMMQFAREFGIKISYLLGENNDKENSYNPHGKYADKRRIVELEGRLG